MDEDKRMRFITLFNPDLDPTGSGYQQRLGRIALGSGKLWGKGIFSGNHQYVPEMYNDFIFSFIGEALGFIGCLAVLGIISALCLRVLQVGRRAKDRLGRFICVGVFSMIGRPDGDECGHVPERAAGHRRHSAALLGRRHLCGGNLSGHRTGHERFHAQQPQALHPVRREGISQFSGCAGAFLGEIVRKFDGFAATS